MNDMNDRHPETELIAYLKDELPPASREAVGRHVDGCAECRETLAAFRGLLQSLGRAAETVPAVHWARYRAELQARLEISAARRRAAWWRRPLPVAVSAGLVAALLVLAFVGPSAWREERRARTPEGLNGFEEVVLGTRLDLLRQYPVVERLDLLEDLDVIRQLDGLVGGRREG
jgi:anti-sigma factor RsiW